jgi:hypothetical protein
MNPAKEEAELECRMLELRNYYLRKDKDIMICLENACYELAKAELLIDRMRTLMEESK